LAKSYDVIIKTLQAMGDQESEKIGSFASGEFHKFHTLNLLRNPVKFNHQHYKQDLSHDI